MNRDKDEQLTQASVDGSEERHRRKEFAILSFRLNSGLRHWFTYVFAGVASGGLF